MTESKTPGNIGGYLRRALTRSNLLAAWDKVSGNRGCAGVDRVSVDTFGRNVQMRLDGLRQQVLAGSYTPLPVLRLWLPKPGKTPRALGVPVVADRVLQTAVALQLMPLFEAEFEDCSFAYRQGRGVRQAVARIETMQRAGYRWVVDADIEAFFDHIPHDRLLAEVAALVEQESTLLALIRQWLRAPVDDHGVLHSPLLGVPQGMPLSPLLANLYLDHLDEALLHENLALVRYADDFVILTKKRPRAEAALELTQATLSSLELKLNQQKTRIVHLDDGLDFLGWTFVRSLAVPRQPGCAPDASAPIARPFAPAQAYTSKTSQSAQSAIHSETTADTTLSTTNTTPLQSAMALAWQHALDAYGTAPNWSVTPSNTPLASAADNPATVNNLDNRDSYIDGLSRSDASTTQDNNALLPADSLQRTLYVVEPGCDLGKESERLQVRKDKTVLLQVPIIHVDQVVLFGQHPVSPACLHLCMKQRVPVVFLSRLGRYLGRLDSADARHTALLQAQVLAQRIPEFCLEMARQFVAGKLKHCAMVLARFARHHCAVDEDKKILHDTILLLRENRHRTSNAQNMEHLRGLEGASARAHFAAMRRMLGPEWLFERRQARPPPDPVNALLSLGYTLLYHAIAGLLQARGFNPYLGFLHVQGTDHYALASDVMEAFRPVVVDALVLDWCLNHKISPASFTMHADGCSLDAQSTRHFLHAFEARLGNANELAQPLLIKGGTLRHRIDRQAMQLARALYTQDSSHYTASGYR